MAVPAGAVMTISFRLGSGWVGSQPSQGLDDRSGLMDSRVAAGAAGAASAVGAAGAAGGPNQGRTQPVALAAGSDDPPAGSTARPLRIGQAERAPRRPS